MDSASPEIVKADKAFRDLVFLLYVAIILAVIAAVKWLLPIGVAHLQSLGWQDFLVTLRWLYLAILISFAPAAVYVILLGMRILRHDQFPLPGGKVMFDTPVIRGPAARRRAKALIWLGAVFLVLMVCSSVYLYVRVTGWLNNPIFRKFYLGDSAVVLQQGGADVALAAPDAEDKA